MTTGKKERNGFGKMNEFTVELSDFELSRIMKLKKYWDRESPDAPKGR
jgi:hypothetical protein